MRIIGNAEKAREVQAVASGVLPSGQPVVVNAAGTVSVVEETNVTQAAGASVAFESDIISWTSTAYDVNSQKIVVAYIDVNNSNYATAVVGTVSGTSISFGTPVVFESSNSTRLSATYDASAEKVVIIFRAGNSGGYGILATVSGTSISFGTRASFDISNPLNISSTYDTNAQKIVVCYEDGDNLDKGTAVVGTVTGPTSISFGSPVVYNNADTTVQSIAYDANAQKVVIAYHDNGNLSYGTAIVGAVSGTTISFGSPVVFNSAGTNSISTTYDASAQKVVIAYYTGTDGTAIVGTVSGTSISFGTAVVFNTGVANYNSIVYHAAAKKVVIAYSDLGNLNYGTAIAGTVSGTSISFDSKLVVESGRVNFVSAAYDPNEEAVVISYENAGNSEYGTSVVFQPTYTSTNLTSDNYIGMSDGVVTGSVSAVGTPAVSSTVQSSYFGSTFDSNSNKVVVTYWDQTNSKGMAVVGTVSGTSISFGTPVEYSSQSAFTYPQAVVFDSNSNKVVISYVDSGGSSYGTAIVGTVSGTSISFGTAVVFESASTAFPQATFDSTNNKVVIIYEDGGDLDKGKAVVGTVSGTSISFGSPVTFEEGLTSYPSVAYDTNAQKVVIAFKDRSAADHGKAIVGTVSGSSISFGSAVTFNAADSNYNTIVYDASAQKLVIYYQDTAATSMKAIVGTVSGTSISFGTATEFSASNSANMSATYDASASKTLVFYRDALNSNYGAYNAGTIDGTSISFSDPVVFEAADSRFTTGTYDSNSQKVIVSYEDVGNSQYATSTVINVGYINRTEVADGDKATIDIKGNVSTNQVGLTAGQSYYVQTDGTLGTTPADPSVFAGTAVAATKLIVKG